MPQVVQKEDKLDDDELDDRAETFHLRELELVRRKRQERLQLQSERRKQAIARWREQQRTAIEQHDWSRFIPLFEERMRFMGLTAIGQLATFLSRHGFYRAASRLRRTLHA